MNSSLHRRVLVVAMLPALSGLVGACLPRQGSTGFDPNDGLGIPGVTKKIEFEVHCDECEVTYRISGTYNTEMVTGRWSVERSVIWSRDAGVALVATPTSRVGAVLFAQIRIGGEVVDEHLDPERKAAGERVHLGGQMRRVAAKRCERSVRIPTELWQDRPRRRVRVESHD